MDRREYNGGFHGPGDAEALAKKLKADAADAGFDPDVIEYETGKAILTMIREATEKRGNAAVPALPWKLS